MEAPNEFVNEHHSTSMPTPESGQSTFPADAKNNGTGTSVISRVRNSQPVSPGAALCSSIPGGGLSVSNAVSSGLSDAVI